MYFITTYPGRALDLSEFTPEQLREHKAKVGSGCVSGKSEKYENLHDLAKRASEITISPCILKDNHRKNQNFVQTNLIVLDIDSNFTLTKAQMVLDELGYKYAIYTSFSHQIWGQDKFHVIIPVDRVIVSQAEFKATYEHATYHIFSHINDDKTKAPSNLFFNSNPKTVQIFCKEEGQAYPKQMEMVKAAPTSVAIADTSSNKKPLTRRVKDFLALGAEPGKWHGEFIIAVQALKASGMTEDEVYDRLERITGTLTEEDVYQIKKGFEDKQFKYDVQVVANEAHPLRLKYINDKGKFINIPSQELVMNFMEENHVIIDLKGQCYMEGVDVPMAILVERIRNFSETVLKQQTPRGHIEGPLENIKYESKIKRFLELKKYVEFDPAASFDFEKLCVAISGKIDHVYIAIIKHFFWQVKRKMNKKAVSYHLMPVFMGVSGSGKSQLIKTMLEPIRDIVYFDGDFLKLSDSRYSTTLTDNYVYFMDEMSKAENSDVETIKNKITSDVVQYRILGTNSIENRRNNATFIGNTNRSLPNIIKDETSVRRFFEIETLNKVDWEYVNTTDFLNLWRSIDENQDQPFVLPIWEEIQKLQQNFRYKSPVDFFLIETIPPVTEEITDFRVTLAELYERYRDYRIKNGYNLSINKHYFNSQVKRILQLKPTYFKKDGKTQYGYYLSKSLENYTIEEKEVI